MTGGHSFLGIFDRGVTHSCDTGVTKMAGRRQAFQNNPELQRFVLPRVRPTGRQLGVGSYGSVEELEVNGLVCAGKRLHEVLLEQGNAGVAEISRKYLLECQVNSRTAVDIGIIFSSANRRALRSHHSPPSLKLLHSQVQGLCGGIGTCEHYQ